jgi:hypothetical protein
MTRVKASIIYKETGYTSNAVSNETSLQLYYQNA